ncbi:MAG: hypothetical protein Q9170_000585 [Blastenia crenularia]
MVLWGVTPLVGSVFARSLVVINKQVDVSTAATLLPLRDQSPAFNTDFMMAAYGIAWLGQALPAWVTAQGALEPFAVEGGESVGFLNQSWTAETTLYGTSLNCEVADAKNESAGFSYSNNKRCTTTAGALNMDPISQYGGLYIGYYLDQSSDFSLSGLGCSSAMNSHLFLALWGQSWFDHPEDNVTAYFCEPKYWTQKVKASLEVPSMEISEIIPIDQQLPLSDDSFNRSAFEYNIGTGAQPFSQRADISETTVIINQLANLAGLGFNSTTTNMVGYALGLSRMNASQYIDPHNLVSSFQNAHKLLHALATKQLMKSESNGGETRPAILSGKANAITVVRPLTITVEAVLGIIAALTIALLVYSRKRTSQLSKDPASLTEILRMVTKPENLGASRSNSTPETRQKRNALLNGKIISLETNEVSPNLPLDKSVNQPLSMPSRTAPGCGKVDVSKDVPFVRPFEMRVGTAVLFITVLFLALATVVALKWFADKNNGLPLPSDKALTNQLLLNYIPIVFATFLEPSWLLLNRVLCVLQPFEELRRGKAKSSRSLDLRYTSLPPQFNFWRSFRGGHWTLSAVCAIGLSANLLAISLGGLLNTGSVSIETHVNITQRYKSVFSRVSGRLDAWDYEYVAKANLSKEATLPPWTAPNTFFVPVTIGTQGSVNHTASYRVRTQGFGIRATCERSVFNDTALITGQQNHFFTEQVTPNGKRVLCGGLDKPEGGQNNSHAALEVFGQLQPVDFSRLNPAVNTNDFVDVNATMEEKLTCNSILIAGFLRANLTVTLDEMKTDYSNLFDRPAIQRINSLSSLWMMCRGTLTTAPYEVLVDQSSHVQTFQAAGPESTNLAAFFSNGTTMDSFLTTAFSTLSNGQDTRPYWHNDTFVDTWFAYFIKQLSNSTLSTLLVDPAQPVPVLTDAAPYVEDLISRLFAIVLGLYHQDWLAGDDSGSTQTGTMLVPSQRVFVSRPMFAITVVLLVMNIVVAAAYWIRRPKKMLPSMPYTIAGILAMTQASGLIKEAENETEWRSDWRFGYGRFVGTDGRPHVGIERRPFVVPLET